MSQRSKSPVSDRLCDSSLDLSENSSISDVDSDHSRDVNLNSKKFTDCNLFGNEQNNRSTKNDELGSNYTSEIECLNNKFQLERGESEKKETQREKSGLILENNSKSDGSNSGAESKKNLVPITNSSTPKPESANSQALCNIFSVSSDGSSIAPENKGQTFLVTLNPSNGLSNEEIGKKFQDLSFAYKTDSMTIQKRLELTKRKRDQAECNIENELKIIKGKLKTLQYSSLNSDCVNLMADLKKQLDFVLNATLQLSSSAESYGYAQHEERLLDLIGVMLQHVENVESSKSESSKGSEKLKEEVKRSSIPNALENCADDDKLLRRRSMAVMASERNSRRRASIATVPRLAYFVAESTSNAKVSHWTPNRTPGNAIKKLSFSNSPRSHSNSVSEGEENRRDSVGARLRRESKTNEGSMKDIDEEIQSSSIESEFVEDSNGTETNIELSESTLNLKLLFGSLEEIRNNSNASDHITAAYCLRRLLEWNKLLLNSTRFRWPENVLHYVPFYITWYVIFVLVFMFFGGFLTGMNSCYAYSCMKFTAWWCAATACLNLFRRFYRILIPLFFLLLLGIALLFLFLTKILLPELTHDEIDSLFAAFGLEIRYLNGPPPI